MHTCIEILKVLGVFVLAWVVVMMAAAGAMKAVEESYNNQPKKGKR